MRLSRDRIDKLVIAQVRQTFVTGLDPVFDVFAWTLEALCSDLFLKNLA